MQRDDGRRSNGHRAKLNITYKLDSDETTEASLSRGEQLQYSQFRWRMREVSGIEGLEQE